MDREMRRKDRLVTDRSWMEQVLRDACILQLGMVDPDGKPYVVPLGFAYRDGAIYVHGAAQGKKNEILAHNPAVCFQVFVDAEVERHERGDDYDMKYRSVTGYGTLCGITEREEKNEALAILIGRFDGPHAPLGDNHERVWVGRIDIERMTGKHNPGPKPEN